MRYSQIRVIRNKNLAYVHRVECDKRHKNLETTKVKETDPLSQIGPPLTPSSQTVSCEGVRDGDLRKVLHLFISHP